MQLAGESKSDERHDGAACRGEHVASRRRARTICVAPKRPAVLVSASATELAANNAGFATVRFLALRDARRGSSSPCRDCGSPKRLKVRSRPVARACYSVCYPNAAVSSGPSGLQRRARRADLDSSGSSGRGHHPCQGDAVRVSESRCGTRVAPHTHSETRQGVLTAPNVMLGRRAHRGDGRLGQREKDVTRAAI